MAAASRCNIGMMTCKQLVGLIVCLVLLYNLLPYLWKQSTPPPTTNTETVEKGVYIHKVEQPSHKSPIMTKIYPHSKEAHSSLTYDSKQFYLNGKPFVILSGSFHYFRTHPAQWKDRLLKMKAMGLNTVATYIPWNIHEPNKGQYDFRGHWNLLSFIEHVQEVGLYLIVRPGPYICAEWEFGGFPFWLLSDPNMELRTSAYQPYLDHVADYFDQLLPILAECQYKTNNGPIIAVQLENEFGSQASYDNRTDVPYLQFLKDLFDRHGIVELTFTSDGDKYIQLGSLPNVLATVNTKDPLKDIPLLQVQQPNRPAMIGELYCGWFDRWVEKYHHKTSYPECAMKIIKALYLKASFNIYMYTGGTNFGFYNGANNATDEEYGPDTASYDYDAPISETGTVTGKAEMIKSIIQMMGFFHVEEQQNVQLAESEKYGYGVIKMNHSMPYQDIVSVVGTGQLLRSVTTMEQLGGDDGQGGQSYGWLLYRKQFDSGKTLAIHGKVEDRGQIFVNGKLISDITWEKNITDRHKLFSVDFPQGNTSVVDILVENNGRVNYKHLMKFQRKGIIGSITVDGTLTSDWYHIPLKFDTEMYELLMISDKWQPYKQYNVPAVYRGTFYCNDEPKDTFFDLEMWTKGIVIVNGYNLGRYWVKGPQRTLYVPAPLLMSGRNEVMVFELYTGAKQINSVAEENLGPVETNHSGDQVWSHDMLQKILQNVTTEYKSKHHKFTRPH